MRRPIPGSTLPALALLTALFACLGSACVLLTPDVAGGEILAPSLGLESVASGFGDVAWSGRASMPERAREAGLTRLAFTTLGFVGVVGAVALLGLLGLWNEESVRRRPEIAVRRAVGATRRQLLKERLAETLILAVAGGALGVLATVLIRGVVGATWPGEIGGSVPGMASLSAALILVGMALGTLLRALSFSARMLPGGVLHSRARLAEASPPKPAHPLLGLLQVACVAAVLTTGTVSLLAVGPSGAASGPEPAGDLHRLEVRRMEAVAEEDRRAVGLGSALASVRGLEEVRLAGYASGGALLGVGATDQALTECGACSAGGLPLPMKGGRVVHHLASADTFDALGLELLRGRTFLPSDGPLSPPVAIVSQSFARENFEDGDPLGRGIRVGESLERWYVVVGVVEDAPRWAIGAREQPVGEVYLSALQHDPRRGVVVLAGSADRGTVASALGAGGWEVRGAEPVYAYLARHRGRVSWFGGAWTGLSLIALLMAVFGVFCTMRLRVRQEVREVGIRRALGAPRRRILLHYLGTGLGLGAVGIGVGLWLSLFALPRLASVPPVDLGLAGRIAGGVVLPLLLAVALGALVPAWRASRTAPHAAIEGGPGG